MINYLNQTKQIEIMLKKTKDKANSISSSIDVLNNLELIPNVLTETEFEILLILVYANHPLNTKEIRNRLINIIGNNERRRRKIEALDKLWEQKSKITLTEYYDKLDKELKKLNIKPPSYERIDNILQSLEKLSLISRRYDDLKKEKYLWLLNPKFITLWTKKRKEIIDELMKADRTVIENLYSFKVIQLFNLESIMRQISSKKAYNL